LKSNHCISSHKLRSQPHFYQIIKIFLIMKIISISSTIKSKWRPAFTVLTILLCTFSCERQSLTPETQTGENTFSCRVNGKVWIPGSTGFFGDDPISGGFRWFVKDSLMGFHIFTIASNGDQIQLHLRSSAVGTHKLNRKTAARDFQMNAENYLLFRKKSGYEYITSNVNIGTVNITKSDTISGILSGTFGGELVDRSGNTINVRNGRFDIIGRKFEK
jgi:hypothetical protein